MDEKSEFEKYLIRSKNGDSVSTLMISYFYQYGKFIKKNLDKAIKYLDKSIQMGNVLANARKIYMGWDKTGNEKMAFKMLENYLETKRSDEEEMIGFHMLGFMYENFEGEEKNDLKAVECYEKAIQLGNDYSMLNLAIKNEKAEGIPLDKKKAKKLYKQSSDLGNHGAMNNLANMYKNGDGVKKSIEKAYKLYVKASDLGNGHAYYNLGILYVNGDYVKKNLQKAAECYEKSSKIEEGNDACYQLGIIFEKGGEGQVIDMEKAAHFYFLSSKKDHKRSAEKFLEIIRKFHVTWKPSYHKFWPRNPGLDSRIILLFLISKNRNSCVVVSSKFLVKGIAFQIVKYLCMYEKRIEENN